MANNPYVNKVQLADGTVKLDLTGDTVTAGQLLSGTTAHDKSGRPITGTYDPGAVFYPVGSLWATDDPDANPGTELGFGTWQLMRTVGASWIDLPGTITWNNATGTWENFGDDLQYFIWKRTA